MAFTLSIDTRFPGHRKTRKFCRLMGSPTAWAHLVELWTWAADQAPDGDLSRIDVEEIEAGAGHLDMDGKCYRAMVDAGFIDEGDGTRSIHDWMEPGHTGYALRKAEAERQRWRKRHGMTGAAEDAGESLEPPRGSRGVPAEATSDSAGVPAAPRFTVHGSGDLPPSARDPGATEPVRQDRPVLGRQATPEGRTLPVDGPSLIQALRAACEREKPQNGFWDKGSFAEKEADEVFELLSADERLAKAPQLLGLVDEFARHSGGSVKAFRRWLDDRRKPATRASPGSGPPAAPQPPRWDPKAPIPR